MKKEFSKEELDFLNNMIKYINTNHVIDYYKFKKYISNEYNEWKYLLKDSDFKLNIYACIKSNRLLKK